MSLILRLLCCAGLFAAVSTLSHAQAPTPRDFGLSLNARVKSGSQPSITLRWNKDDNQQAVYIWKKLKDIARFDAEIYDSVVGKGLEWTDTEVEVGKSYEYRVFRLVARTGATPATFYGTGYINAEIGRAHV